MKPDKLTKTLGKDTIEEMDAMHENELKDVVVQANTSMKQAQEELEANEKYQDLKLRLNDVTQGKKDVDKRQKARIAYSLKRLQEMGKLDLIERMDLIKQTESRKLELKAKREKAAAEDDAPDSEPGDEEEGSEE